MCFYYQTLLEAHNTALLPVGDSVDGLQPGRQLIFHALHAMAITDPIIRE
jgi:hypothetical protein